MKRTTGAAPLPVLSSDRKFEGQHRKLQPSINGQRPTVKHQRSKINRQKLTVTNESVKYQRSKVFNAQVGFSLPSNKAGLLLLSYRMQNFFALTSGVKGKAEYNSDTKTHGVKKNLAESLYAKTMYYNVYIVRRRSPINPQGLSRSVT